MQKPFTITVREFAEKKALPAGYKVYLWTECGEGALEEARYIRSDWWIKCGDSTWGMSYCVCPDSLLICCYESDKAEIEARYQEILKARREYWKTCTGLEVFRAPAYPVLERA